MYKKHDQRGINAINSDVLTRYIECNGIYNITSVLPWRLIAMKRHPVCVHPILENALMTGLIDSSTTIMLFLSVKGD